MATGELDLNTNPFKGLEFKPETWTQLDLNIDPLMGYGFKPQSTPDDATPAPVENPNET